LGIYAASSGSSLPKFRHKTSVASSTVKNKKESRHQPTIQRAEGGDSREHIRLSAARLAIPVFTASPSSVTDTFIYNRGWAYCNDFTVAFETSTWTKQGPLRILQ
jgi:hypothetical protein